MPAAWSDGRDRFALVFRHQIDTQKGFSFLCPSKKIQFRIGFKGKQITVFRIKVSDLFFCETGEVVVIFYISFTFIFFNFFQKRIGRADFTDGFVDPEFQRVDCPVQKVMRHENDRTKQKQENSDGDQFPFVHRDIVNEK